MYVPTFAPEHVREKVAGHLFVIEAPALLEALQAFEQRSDLVRSFGGTIGCSRSLKLFVEAWTVGNEAWQPVVRHRSRASSRS